MNSRITHTRAPADEPWHLHAESHGRRWDDPPPAPVRPSKLRQRAAVLLVLATITVCVGVLVVLCGGHA